MKPDAFLSQFMLPLVGGGPVHVGSPLGAAGLAALVDTKHDPAITADIALARQAVAETLLIDAIQPQLDIASLRLAVALHDLLFLLHPATSGTLVRDKRLALVAAHAADAARLPPTTDADDLVARHTVLHNFSTLARTDVRVSFWVGRREFHGEEPPKRLLAWPSIRQVREERWRASCFVEAAAHAHGAPVVRALLDGSPLTDLLHPVRIEPKLALGRMADVLVEPAATRLVAYQYLDIGLDKVGGALAQATLSELDGRDRDLWRVRWVLAFIAHLHLCLVLPMLRRPAGEPAPSRADAAMRLVGPGGDGSLRDFYGLYAALRRTAPDLAAPGDVRRDRRLDGLCAEHAAACETACGQSRAGELAALITRAVGMPSLLSGAA